MAKRCDWATNDPEMVKYHDTEWGVPLHDDRKLFEFIVLEGFQAGLSWSTVLKKREAFREVFAGFDPEQVANFAEADVERLMQDNRIIRNRLKILAAINNAKQFLKIREEFGSFDRYKWDFVNHKPIVNHFEKLSDLPAKSTLSDTISKVILFVNLIIPYLTALAEVALTLLYRYLIPTGLLKYNVNQIK